MSRAGGIRPQYATAVRAVLLATLIAIAAACDKKEESAPQPRLVNVVRVSMDTTDGDVAYSGEVRARYETNLSFRVAGKIVARNVEVGSTVRAGAVLARLDPEDQQLNTRSAQSQLEAAKSEFEQTKAELERYSDLLQEEFHQPGRVRTQAECLQRCQGQTRAGTGAACQSARTRLATRNWSPITLVW